MPCLGAALDKAFQAVLLKYLAKTKLISDRKNLGHAFNSSWRCKITASQSYYPHCHSEAVGRRICFVAARMKSRSFALLRMTIGTLGHIELHLLTTIALTNNGGENHAY